MNKYYIILLALLVGLLGGIIQYDLTVPVFGENGVYYHGVRGQNQIALMINVDWGEKYIPDILKILEENEVNATFFVTGTWAQKHPDLLREMSEKGHEIGNHGYSHKHIKNLSNQQIINLIKKNEQIINEITGQKTQLFTPPYGELDNRISSIVQSINYKTVMWTADTIDWQRPSPQIIIQRAVNKIEDGGILLMHPTHPSLKALPQILNKLKNRGFEFKKISPLISYNEDV
ncbi:MAG: polysaccharide deacetylase family protein [Bacillota bacterium]